MKIAKVLLCSVLVFGCTNVTSQGTGTTVGDILSETKTTYKPPMVCPARTTMVCDGPDKRTIEKFQRHYCKCISRQDLERALENMSRPF
tara:strand:+ start:3273 stop:3539 length:267 start_codon:yes stop_codon:yes gene_type:complete